jgi:hypothetical protein
MSATVSHSVTHVSRQLHKPGGGVVRLLSTVKVFRLAGSGC